MIQPLVSIITPCFNCGKFIAQTIESVLAQTYRNWEMIIWDDYSVDDSLNIAKRYAARDSRIKVLGNSSNQGAAITRNEAIKYSSGTYLAFLDADDLWVPTKLEKQLKFMQENDCDFSFAMFEYIDEDGHSLLRQAKVIDNMPYWKMLLFDWAGCLTVMYRQDLNNKIYSDNIRQCNDYALFLNVVKHCRKVMGIHECLALYRVRKAGISKNKKTKYGNLKRVIHEFQGHPLPLVWLCMASRVFVKIFLQFQRINPQDSNVKRTINTLVLIGGLALGRTPYDGETMKDRLLLQRFLQLGYKVIPVDTLRWNRRPWVLLRLAWVLLRYRKAKFVISASQSSRYLLAIMDLIPYPYHCYNWVIGRKIVGHVQQGLYRISALKACDRILVEGEEMVQQLQAIGLTNVIYVPNFKPINYNIGLQERKAEDPFRFVFFSRIREDKGCGEIVQATALLLQQGINRFEVDFYGAMDEDYKTAFLAAIAPYPNLHYKGFLNLYERAQDYEQLASYDCMLFPTFWYGEGFPGVVIDAYIAGLPILASDWNLNRYYIRPGENGFLFPVHDVPAMTEYMKKVMDSQFDLSAMRKRCQQEAERYDVVKVVSKELMHELGFDD